MDAVSGERGKKEKENYPVARRYADELSFEEKELRWLARREREWVGAETFASVKGSGAMCACYRRSGDITGALPREAFRKFASRRRR